MSLFCRHRYSVGKVSFARDTRISDKESSGLTKLVDYYWDETTARHPRTRIKTHFVFDVYVTYLYYKKCSKCSKVITCTAIEAQEYENDLRMCKELLEN